MGQVWPGTQLRQTLSVEQGPGAAVVGGELQAHTEQGGGRRRSIKIA